MYWKLEDHLSSHLDFRVTGCLNPLPVGKGGGQKCCLSASSSRNEISDQKLLFSQLSDDFQPLEVDRFVQAKLGGDQIPYPRARQRGQMPGGH